MICSATIPGSVHKLEEILLILLYMYLFCSVAIVRLTPRPLLSVMIPLISSSALMKHEIMCTTPGSIHCTHKSQNQNSGQVAFADVHFYAYKHMVIS